MQNGQQSAVLFVDGLKIGNTTKLSYATGIMMFAIFEQVSLEPILNSLIS